MNGVGPTRRERTQSKLSRRSVAPGQVAFLTLVVALALPVTRPLAAQEGTTPAPSPTTVEQATVTATKDATDTGGPELLKAQIRIVATTNAPTTGSAQEKAFRWDWSWQGWQGLHLGISQQTPLDDPFAQTRQEFLLTNRVFHLEQVKMTAKIGARIEVDAAGFVTTGSLQDFDGGVQLRRLRLITGGDCLLLLPVSYYIELGYSPSQFAIENSYLMFRNLGVLGTLKLGQYTTPFSLNAYTSSRDIRFMEPAAPVTALAPGVNAGVEVGRAVFNERMTWKLGFFGDGSSSDSGDASQDYGRAVLRLTGLPIARESPEDPSEQQLLHLGLNFNWLYSASSSVRYRTRPESHLAPYVLDTGDIDAKNASMVDAEAAWINGPLSLQGEFLAGQVNDTQGLKPVFYGFYAQAGWFLTGESRPYLRKEGRFGRIVPLHDFKWHGGGWGSFEVLGRFSYTDLNSDNVAGGRMGLVTAGVSWHPSAHTHWAFNFITGQADGPDGDGWMNIIETRVEVDF